MKNLALILFSKRLLPLLLLGVSSGCSIFGIRSGYEEAPFASVEKFNKIEIRDYDELVLVQTQVESDYRNAGNKAFKKLFRYISGSNVSKAKIAMTTPVLATEGAGEKIAMTTPVLNEAQSTNEWLYSFVLPAEYTLQSAPTPTDPSVKLVVLPKRTSAVLRYTGSWNEGRMREKTAALQEWILIQGYKCLSNPRVAAYDPPWTIPALRRNEIVIDIERL